MGKVIGGWLLILFCTFTMLCGVLLFGGGVFESEKRVHNIITGLVIMFVSFRLLRLGWAMRAPNRSVSGVEAGVLPATTPPPVNSRTSEPPPR